MKHSRTTASQIPSADPSMDDESNAMVYVGDVYSLVVQEESEARSAERRDGPRDEDSLWPLIR